MTMFRLLLVQLVSSAACLASVSAFTSSRINDAVRGGGGVGGYWYSSRRIPIVAVGAIAEASLLSEDDVVPTTNSSLPTPTDNHGEEFYYDEVVRAARDDLVALSQTLTSSNGGGSSSKNVYVRRPSDAIRLLKEIDRLEAMVASSNNNYDDNNFQRRRRKKELLVGDWTLIATANVPSSRFRGRTTNDNKMNDSSDRNSNGFGWFNNFQEAPSIEVTQRIRSTANEKAQSDGDENGTNATTTTATMEIDRVDNIIEISSPTTDENNMLLRLLNPLSISKTKLVLIHNANIESVYPVLRTKIAWVSTVLNVAGGSSTTTSSSSNQFFDANGQDLLGINNLFGEYLNVGSFDTPFVDERVRVSRSPGPVFETVRVFVRKVEQ
jgi:hypothetical protein